MRNLHRHGTSAMMRTAATTPSSPAFIGMIPKHYEKHVKTVAIVFAAMVCVAPVKFFSTIWHLLFQVVGIALGVGFGFGLAMHVYEQLQQMHKASEVQTRGGRRLAVDDIRPKTTSRQTSNVLEDGTSFFSLMASAGYPQDTRVLRGQVLRENASFWDNQYRFTDVTVEEQRGPRLLQEEWPSLPPSVTKELGRFVEHLMRDFISGWYCKIDKGVVFTPEAEKRKDGIARDGGKSLQDSSETSAGGGGQEQQTQEQQPTHHVSRKMVFSTQLYRQIPMIDQTYRVLSATFGNLATRAECVNVFQLALLKIPKVLAHTFKVYRHLRKSAEDKNMTENPSEIQVIREFLLAGKLHRAVTFGLDVPSLLFADASGEECGNGSDEPPNPNPKDPLQVLEQRLFQTPMLKECEVDYNRVVAHRLVRALLPRADSSSQVVMALNVEIFAACVLQPLMNLWIPSFLNNMIVSAMKKKKQYAEINKDREVAQDTDNTMADGVTKIAKNGAEVTGKSPEKTRNSIATVASVPVDYATTSSSLLDSDKEANMSTVDPLSKESSILSMEIDSEVADEIDLQDEDIDMAEHDDFEEKNAKILGKLILKITSLALIELQKYMKFEECRLARGNLKENRVDWDNPACQAAVLRLVMVIEAVLLQGRCMYRRAVETNGVDEEGTEIRKETERPIANDSFPQLLMEMTSDMNAFEKRIDAINAEGNTPMLIDDTSVMDFEPDPSEISTLRTLVSTWLHTGQAFRAISLIIKAQKNAFAPFYCNNAFLSVPGDADGFLELVKVLDGVDVMVETMAVLSSPRLDLEAESDLVPSLSSLSVVASKAARKAKSDFGRSTDDQTSTTHAAMAHFGNTSTPRYLDFHRNSAFASSLRSERERRMRSWETLAVDETIQTVHRKSASSTDIELHQELHNLSRIFYNGTNVMTIRDAARKSDSDERQSEPATGTGDQEKVSLLTVEMVSNRRRIEVPDDDSSFLLRAQPRPLNLVSVHRDDRNHDLSYKCFLATYEEPAIPIGSNRYNGGKYIRRCFLQYYPIDRTATIMLHNDARKLDRRKGKPMIQDLPTQQNKSPTYLSAPFLRGRHLCQKWTPKGVATQNFLSSSVMEATDFNAAPRSGKALDFVYRMSLFQCPTIDLDGKRFTVQDSAARGPHRADASALEVSDAALSALLSTIGRDYEPQERRAENADQKDIPTVHKVEMGPDGYPMIFMKLNKKQGDQVSTEIKPYRLSFVRAALMVTSARQEAQLQCLIQCVRAGSAKSATKTRTEAQLRPTLKILDFANDRSADKTRASSLLRDLKLGVYHIDREQLRRNGLLNPRNPTSILELKAKVEGAVQAKDVADVIGGKLPPASTLYKIRCIALVELLAVEENSSDLEPYSLADDSLAEQYQEEWVVYRSMRDFQALHKQLKSIVAPAESSASTGYRLVGAASAAFGNSGPQRQRNALVPSLAQATKTGAIAVTKKAIMKRGELLDGYLDYLLASSDIMNRSSELLLFLGASYPFPPEVKVMRTPTNLIDPLGRLNFIRRVKVKNSLEAARGPGVSKPEARLSQQSSSPETSISAHLNESIVKESFGSEGRGTDSSEDTKDLKASILNKVDQVPLAEVRNRIVELVRYQFGFENASFFRSQMLSALETASFVAITKASDFRNMLYNLHVKHLNPDAVANWIKVALDILWPDGVWLTPAPLLTEEEEAVLREKSRKHLHDGFPEQIRSILGQELTKDGLDVFHEMLQNRIVIKSLFYMLFDLVWIEVFPELRDALTCASVLIEE